MGRVNVAGGGVINPPLNATVSRVLEGYEFSINGKEILVGTMVDRGALNVAATDNEQSIQGGYYSSITIAARPVLSGNSLVGDVLATKTFYNSTYTKQTGAMENKGELNITPSDVIQTGTAGYYSGITVAARPVLSGNAAAGEVLAGRSFYNSTYTKQNGAMANRAGAWHPPNQAIPNGSGTLYVVPPAGYYNGLDYAANGGVQVQDPNYVSANILASKPIFGLAGGIPTLGSEEYPGWRRALVSQPSSSTRVHLYIPRGHYAGTGNGGEQGVFADDPEFVPGNILATANVFGMQGSIPVRNNTDTGGTYPIAFNHSFWEGMAYLMPPAGYYNGDTWVRSSQPNLIASNIRAGIAIGSITGTMAAGTPSASGVIAGSMTGQYNTPDYRYISGLSFVPSKIIVTYEYNNGSTVQPAQYRDKGVSVSLFDSVGAWVKASGTHMTVFCDVAPTGGGFQLRAMTSSNTMLYTFSNITWFAYQ